MEMDWRIVLVLVVAAIIIIGTIIVVFWIRYKNGQIDGLLRKVEIWKGRAETLHDQIERLQFDLTNKRLI